MIVGYNLMIGLLVMLASDKLGGYAGKVSTRYKSKIARLARVSSFTFGSTVAAISAFTLVAFHWLKIGV